jgi:hypothetical protein
LADFGIDVAGLLEDRIENGALLLGGNSRRVENPAEILVRIEQLREQSELRLGAIEGAVFPRDVEQRAGIPPGDRPHAHARISDA